MTGVASPYWNPPAPSRTHAWARLLPLLRRLRTHGLIEKVARRYKDYLAKLGRRVLVTALVICECFVQPTLARDAR